MHHFAKIVNFVSSKVYAVYQLYGTSYLFVRIALIGQKKKEQATSFLSLEREKQQERLVERGTALPMACFLGRRWFPLYALQANSTRSADLWLLLCPNPNAYRDTMITPLHLVTTKPEM